MGKGATLPGEGAANVTDLAFVQPGECESVGHGRDATWLLAVVTVGGDTSWDRTPAASSEAPSSDSRPMPGIPVGGGAGGPTRHTLLSSQKLVARQQITSRWNHGGSPVGTSGAEPLALVPGWGV